MAAGKGARATCVLLASVLVAGCATRRVGPAPELDLGPVASHGLTLGGDDRIRAAGPLYETQRAANGATYAGLHPLIGSIWDPVLDRRLTEFLWPVGMKKDFRGETDWRFLVAFGHDFASLEKSRYRYVVFPVVAGGRDAEGEGYFGVFPIAGSLHEFYGYDRWRFVLFPLYSASQKKDQRGWAVLWPILARTRGDKLDAFRVFPFYGYREKEGEYRNSFVLWPFFTRATYHDQRNGDGSGFLVFPLYGQSAYKESRTWFVIPPLFRYTVGPGHRVLNCPWPIIQIWRDDLNKNYLWPIVGRRWDDVEDYHFVLWPFVTWRQIERVDHRVKEFRISPLLFLQKKIEKPRTPHSLLDVAAVPSDVTCEAASEVLCRVVRLWPLFDYTRMGGERRFRMLDLWPARGMGGIDRNWAPLWTLYSRTGLGEARESELLWGLYRNRVQPGKGRAVSVFPLFSWSRADNGDHEWSFLLGLLGHSRQSGAGKVRLIWLFDVGGGRRDNP